MMGVSLVAVSLLPTACARAVRSAKHRSGFPHIICHDVAAPSVRTTPFANTF
jgi:hypothetical protein